MTNTLERRMGGLEKRIDRIEGSIKDLVTTVEDLAISVKNGFDQMVTKEEFNERMDRVEFRYNGHDRRIEILEDKVGIINRKIGLSRK